MLTIPNPPRAGRVPKLAPGETRHFALDVAIQADRAEVAAAVARVRGIQGDRQVVVEMTPES